MSSDFKHEVIFDVQLGQIASGGSAKQSVNVGFDAELELAVVPDVGFFCLLMGRDWRNCSSCVELRNPSSSPPPNRFKIKFVWKMDNLSASASAADSTPRQREFVRRRQKSNVVNDDDSERSCDGRWGRRGETLPSF